MLAGVMILLALVAWASTRPNPGANPTPTPVPGAPSPTSDTAEHAGPGKDTSTPSATVTSNPSHPEGPTLAKPIGPNNNTSTASRSEYVDSTCQTVIGAACYIQALPS